MDLLKDKQFNKQLSSLVLPIAFQQFMLNFVGASDAVMLGLVGQSELSAVSLAGQVQFLLSLFLAAVTIGTNMFAAQYWGRRDIRSVEMIFAIAMRIAVPISAVFSCASALFPSYIMRLFTSESTLIGYGANYLRLVSPSYLFSGISQIYLCAMKNCGMAKKSTLISTSCVIADAVMNAVLILGLIGFPPMGVAGAALSTSIARLVEVLCVAVIMQRGGNVKLRLQYLHRPNRRLRRDFWKYTTPVLGNEQVWGVGVTMSTVILGHLGNDAAAANAIASVTKNLAVCICLGLASGGGIMVGNELGAGNLDNAKIYGKKLCHLSVICGIISGAVILSATPAILRFSSLTARSTRYLKWMLLICSYYMVGKSVNSTTIAGIFCAGGDSRFGFLCDAVVMWGVIVPLGFISAFVWELPVPVVYFILSMDEFVKIPAVIKHYKKYIWVKNLTVKENGSCQ